MLQLSLYVLDVDCLKYVIMKCDYQGDSNSVADGCGPASDGIRKMTNTMPVNKTARKQTHRRQPGEYSSLNRMKLNQMVIVELLHYA